MTRLGAMLFIAACVAGAAAQDMSNRTLIAQVTTQHAQPPAAPATSATPAEDLDAAERAARADANLALARLELVLARKLSVAGDHKAAATKAVHARELLAGLRPADEIEELRLQIDGLLVRAARAGVQIDAQNDASAVDDAAHDAQAQAAARVARQYTGPARPEVDQSGNAQALRERALQRTTGEPYSYRPGAAIIDTDALDALERQRLQYQGTLRDAYRNDEQRALVEAQEARLIPESDVNYPADWPQRVARRAKYAGGQVARGPSYFDEQGREWYMAVYDIHDLIYVPPDFEPLWDTSLDESLNELLDRREFWRNAYLFFGRDDPYAAVPLLRFFGGLDAIAARGPKYSLERQDEIVQMIRSFVGGQVEAVGDGAVVLPPAPR